MKKKPAITAAALSLIIVLNIICPGFASAAELPFTDVPRDAWYYDAVLYASEHNLMNGVDSTSFDPNGPVTRAMLAAVLYRYDGSPYISSVYGGVYDSKWYASYVFWLCERGIVDAAHYEYRPDDAATREELALMLYNYAMRSGIPVDEAADLSKYSDAGQISPKFLGAVRWANAVSLINGRSETEIDPSGSLMRSELATLLMRMDKLFGQKTPLFEISSGQPDLIRSNDGYVLYEHYSEYPVFKGDSGAAKAMTAAFPRYGEEDNFAWVIDSYDKYEHVKEYIHNGNYWYSVSTCRVTYLKNGVASFAVDSSAFTGGAHGSSFTGGYTFDLATGKEIKLTDVLNVDSSNVSKILDAEFLKVHELDEIFAGSGFSTLEQIFYLGNDGVHVYYDEYTFAYAYGAREIVIPYSRTDLVNARFSVFG